MRHLKETLGRLYFDKANYTYNQLYQSLKERGNTEIENITWNAQEVIGRIVLVLLLVVSLIYILSFPPDLFRTAFIILVSTLFAFVFLLPLFEEYANDQRIKEYEEAANVWENLDPNLPTKEKAEHVKNFFYEKNGRSLRFGEINCIKRNVEDGISFRDDIYTYRDRLLFVKICTYGPLLKDWDVNPFYSKITQAYIKLWSLITVSTMLSVTFIFQTSIVKVLRFYVMRGIEPNSNHPVESKSPQRPCESTKIKDSTTGKVTKGEVTKDDIYDRYWMRCELDGWKRKAAYNEVKNWLLNEIGFTKKEVENKFPITLEFETFVRSADNQEEIKSRYNRYKNL